MVTEFFNQLIDVGLLQTFNLIWKLSCITAKSVNGAAIVITGSFTTDLPILEVSQKVTHALILTVPPRNPKIGFPKTAHLLVHPKIYCETTVSR